MAIDAMQSWKISDRDGETLDLCVPTRDFPLWSVEMVN